MQVGIMNPSQFSTWMDAPRSVLIMGIINATPDSFSDGGLYMNVDAAAHRACELVAAGADMLDIGGESTRPGATPVTEDEQIRRVVPAIQAIRRHSDIAISIDTTRSRVAQAALDAGANLINDTSAGRDDEHMFALAARRGANIVLMHMRGTPATMNTMSQYADVSHEVRQFLLQRLAAAQAAGIDRKRILLDPGIGFAKTVAQDLLLLRDLKDFAALGQPIVIGASRKRFIGAVTGETDPARRIFGTAATVAWAATNGAGVIRVHDVAAMVQVLKMTRAIAEAK